MNNRFFTIFTSLNFQKNEIQNISENPWKSEQSSYSYDIEKVDEDIGHENYPNCDGIDLGVSVNTLGDGKEIACIDTDPNITARNSITTSRNSISLPSPIKTTTTHTIKSTSTLSPSDRQIRHSKIALNNISKIFEKLVKERDSKSIELETLESKRMASEIDLQNITVLLEKYTSIQKDLVHSIKATKLRQDKLEEDIKDLDDRLTLIGTETTSIEGLVSSLQPTGQVDQSSLINVFFGHDESVEAVDFGNGRMVTGSADRTCRVWDLEGKRCIGVLDGHDGWIRDIQVEGFMVVSGSGDHTAKLWDISLLQDPENLSNPNVNNTLDAEKELDFNADKDCLIKTFYGHSGGVTCLQFEGSTLLTGSLDKSIKTWDMETGTNLATLTDFDGDSISSAHTLSDEGRSHIGSLHFYQHALASGFGDGVVRLFDLRSLKCHRTLDGHSATVTGLMFDDYEVITGSLDKTLRIWDLRMGKTINCIETPGNITDLSIDHSRIAVACGSKDIKVYSRLSGECETLVGHGKVVRAVKLNGGRLLSGGYDSTVRLWALSANF